MRRYTDVVLIADAAGFTKPAAFVSVTVFIGGSNTKAPLFSDDGITASPNPVTGDAVGRYSFYVADGRYDLQFSGTGFTAYKLLDIDIFDADDITISGRTPIVGNLTFTGNNLHTGTETFTGAIAGVTSFTGNTLFTGNNTHSGIETFTGDAFFKSGRPWIDVQALGAKGDTKKAFAGHCTAGSSGISSTAFFTSTAVDAGKVIELTGCGPAGAALVTTIVSVADASHATIATTASTTFDSPSFIMGTDDTAAIQAAINAAKTNHASGTVFFPNGTYMVSQLTAFAGVNLIGSGTADTYGGSGAGGSRLQQLPGTDLDVIVFSSGDSFFPQTEFCNFSMRGALGTVSSSGINATKALNYGTLIHHIDAGNFAFCGFRLSRGNDGCRLFDLSAGGNGVGAGVGYGIELTGLGTDSASICPLSGIVGDDNKTALIHLLTGPGMGEMVSFHLSNIKGEKHTAGRQNDLILLDNMNGTPVFVATATALNNSGEEADAVIKIVNATVDLTWFGLNAFVDANHGAGNGYSFLVNDAFQGLTFPVSATGTSGTNRPFGSFGFINLVLGAVTFSNLGTPANGNLHYCSDCTIANPCAGGGTGALAKRLNNTWVCN
jgi:hypothetical protein